MRARACVSWVFVNDARRNYTCVKYRPTTDIASVHLRASEPPSSVRVERARTFVVVSPPRPHGRMTSSDDLRQIGPTCPPASRRLHSSSAVEKVDGGVSVWGITIGSNFQIALPVFGTLFLVVGLVLTGTRTWYWWSCTDAPISLRICIDLGLGHLPNTVLKPVTTRPTFFHRSS